MRISSKPILLDSLCDSVFLLTFLNLAGNLCMNKVSVNIQNPDLWTILQTSGKIILVT